MDKVSDDFYELEIALRHIKSEIDNFRENAKGENHGGMFFSAVRIVGGAALVVERAATLAQTAFNLYVQK